jgi:hemerythrin-like domain-containing protein
MTTSTELLETTGVNAFLTRQHQRLDHIMADVEFLAARRSYVQAAKRFAEFRWGMENHMAVEERVLLPLFVEKTGDPDGIAATIRDEHTRLQGLLDEIGQSLSQWDYARFGRLIDELNTLTQEHHRHEERLLHPMLESALGNEGDWQRICYQAQVEP